MHNNLILLTAIQKIELLFQHLPSGTKGKEGEKKQYEDRPFHCPSNSLQAGGALEGLKKNKQGKKGEKKTKQKNKHGKEQCLERYAA